jgi:pimeloyl-ACP methyl ester carboxylesterase
MNPSTPKKRALKQGLIGIGAVAILLLLLVVLPAFALAPTPPDWAPEPVVLWGFDMRLLISRPLTNFSTLAQAVGGETAVAYAPPAQQVRFQSDDGLTIVGDLYQAAGGEGKPAILLLHGSTPQGRQLGLYRLMGERLAELGYVVLAIDLRGYGQSDDPPDVANPASFDFTADVAAGLEYLAGLPEVDPEQLFLVGHSMGGDVAITAVAHESANVEKLVLIGPGRRFLERGGTLDTPEFDYFRRREMRYMRLPQAISAETFQAYRATLPLENHIGFLAQPDHTPLLLLDGALESLEDQEFLRAIFNLAAGEKGYATLTDADHYVNVANFGRLLVYDETAVGDLLQELDTFFRE